MNDIPEIVCLDGASLPSRLRPPRFPHRWREYKTTPAELVLERLTGATIAITNRVPIGAEVLDQLPGLRFIAIAATGFDHVDVKACSKRRVLVSNIRGWCTASVAEHVFALILALRRNLVGTHQEVLSGAWHCSLTPSIPINPTPILLSGSTLGIVGGGQIAERVSEIGRGFGMNVLLSERKGALRSRPGRIPFDECLKRSAVISIHCPLTEETRGLIGKRELDLLDSKTILINCARGGIVDEEALAEALRKGKIGGAGLDVLREEPPSKDNPVLNLRAANVIVTPHTAWVSQTALDELAEQTIQNLECFVAGKPKNLVSP